jgi:hypothetical protein
MTNLALCFVSRPVKDEVRRYRGFNLFDGDDLDLFRAIVQGEFNISGFQNRNLRRYLSGKSAHQVSRLLDRLRKHGLIKEIAHTYKYYLTALGRKVTALALKLREMDIVPSLYTALKREGLYGTDPYRPQFKATSCGVYHTVSIHI